ncbi:MAG: MoaD/ThiS family protein, partial [Gammaproteobacteria bacterium]
MSRVIVRIPMPLRSLTAGAEELAVEGATVGQALACLGATYPGVLARILTPEGQIRSFVNIYLGQENVHAIEGLDTALPEGGV